MNGENGGDEPSQALKQWSDSSQLRIETLKRLKIDISTLFNTRISGLYEPKF